MKVAGECAVLLCKEIGKKFPVEERDGIFNYPILRDTLVRYMKSGKMEYTPQKSLLFYHLLVTWNDKNKS